MSVGAVDIADLDDFSEDESTLSVSEEEHFFFSDDDEEESNQMPTSSDDVWQAGRNEQQDEGPCDSSTGNLGLPNRSPPIGEERMDEPHERNGGDSPDQSHWVQEQPQRLDEGEADSTSG